MSDFTSVVKEWKLIDRALAFVFLILLWQLSGRFEVMSKEVKQLNNTMIRVVMTGQHNKDGIKENKSLIEKNRDSINGIERRIFDR